MLHRFNRFYCQYSGIIMSFALVFVFLIGIRTYSTWEKLMATIPAFLCTLFTSILFSYVAYFVFDRLRLFIYKQFPGSPSSCSTNIHKK